MKKVIISITTLALTLGMITNAFAGIQPRYGNTGYVFSCVGDGGNDDNDSIDTLKECQNVCDYINKWDLYAELKVNPKLSEFSDGRLDSPIIYFAGHGNYNFVNTGSNSGISDGEKTGYKNIRNVKLTETKLAVLSACNTASIPGNITERLNLNGADFTLGWKAVIDNEHARRFSAAFFKYLDKQYNYINSISYALNDLSNGADGEPAMFTTANIFKYACYGNKYATIYSDATRNSVDKYAPFFNENLEQYKVNDDIYYKYKSNDFLNIEKYFKENIDENFKITDYKPLEAESFADNEFNIIQLRYKVGDMMSDFGYNIVTDNSKLIVITKVGNKITNDGLNIPQTQSLENTIRKEAINDLNISYPVYSQEIEKIYDTKEEKVKYTVLTTYGDESNGFFAKSYEYLR